MNAVIMAAGMSTRFVPISLEKPKGLLVVKNEVLIERQIEQLQEAGIKEIVIVLGYKKEAIIMLVVTLATCGIGGSVMGIIGLIEGIMYLTKSDEEFQEIYVQGYKGWF